jgi:hypothetical protein
MPNKIPLVKPITRPPGHWNKLTTWPVTFFLPLPGVQVIVPGMNVEDLISHRAGLIARIDAIELEKSQLARKLKAIDVLLEGEGKPPIRLGAKRAVTESVTVRQGAALKKPRKRTMASHAVRFSPRISLIGAVEELAMKQLGAFDSTQILAATQKAYPEFNLSETKHISSPLSDLVKKGVLAIERERRGKMPNIYRFVRK